MQHFFKLLLLVLGMQPALLCGQINPKKSMRKSSPNFFVGVEAIAGTHGFLMSSDIPELSGLKSMQSGNGLGLVTGTRYVRVRARKSNYQSAQFVKEKLSTRAFEGSLNVYPLQIGGNRFRSYEPYLIAGFGRSTYHFYGNYVSLPPPPPNPQVAQLCPDLLDEELMDQPEPEPQPHTTDVAVIADQLPEGTLLEAMKTNDLFAGIGMEAHIQGKRIFVHLFGEVKYVLPKKHSIINPAFTKTSIGTPVLMSVGIGVGLAR